MGQWTGEVDSEGNEIYEGDLLLFNRGYVDDSQGDYFQGNLYVVRCANGKFSACNDTKRYYLGFDSVKDGRQSYYHLKGNIHQHPQLLEQ